MCILFEKGRIHDLKKWLGSLALLALVTGCNSIDEKSKTDEPKIVVTTGQIADVVDEVGGDYVQVEALMGPGVDPHLYKATQGDLAKLNNADMIFYNGLHLEGQMVDIFEQMGKQKTVTAISDGIEENDLLKDKKNPDLHDPHIWFDIELWKDVTKKVTATLIKEYPENEKKFKDNQNQYLKELEDLQQFSKEKIQEIPEKQRVLVTAHDAFNYFGKSQGFEVRGLQGLSTESEYGVKDVQDMVDFLVKNKIKAIFVESSVSDKAMTAIIDGAKKKGHDVVIGGELYSDAMGAKDTKEGTYTGMYQHNINTIVDALK